MGLYKNVSHYCNKKKKKKIARYLLPFGTRDIKSRGRSQEAPKWLNTIHGRKHKV